MYKYFVNIPWDIIINIIINDVQQNLPSLDFGPRTEQYTVQLLEKLHVIPACLLNDLERYRTLNLSSNIHMFGYKGFEFIYELSSSKMVPN